MPTQPDTNIDAYTGEYWPWFYLLAIKKKMPAIYWTRKQVKVGYMIRLEAEHPSTLTLFKIWIGLNIINIVR